MFKLFNTVAWLTSISFWFVICVLVWMLMGDYDIFDADLFILWVFVTFIMWSIVKSMFLSEESIEKSMIELRWLVPLIKKWEKLEKSKSKDSALSFANKKTSFSQIHESAKVTEEEDDEQQYQIVSDDDVQDEAKYKDSSAKEEKQYWIVHENNIQHETEYGDSSKEEKKIKVVKEKKRAPEEPWFLQKFFSENLLAKVWAILLFLWVLFFLSLIYQKIWNVWKLIIWFSIGFLLYWVWVVIEKRWLKNESRILLWTWILINYLVILSWKYLLWDASWLSALTEWTCFLFLLMNTIFAIITSLVYESNALLWFSFLFAYVNPLLVWASHDSPYTFLIYWITVSLWALWLASVYKDKSYSQFLIFLAFIGWNLLFLLASCNNSIWWISKILFSWILSFASIVVAYRKWNNDILFQLFLWSYIVLIFHFLFWYSSIWTLYLWATSLISYALYMLVISAGSIYFFLSVWTASFLYLLFFPILIFMWLILSWSLMYIIPVLIWVVVMYMFLLAFLFENLSALVKYWLFTIVWIFIFISSSYISISMAVTFGQGLAVMITTFIFLICAYYFSSKKWLEYLYTLWSLWSIFILLPVIKTHWELYTISIIWIILYFILNSTTPLFNKNLTRSHIKNMIIWTISWIIFVWYEIYNFLDASNQWLMVMWVTYLSIAIYYFALSTKYYSQVSIILNEGKSDNVFIAAEKENTLNIFYSYIWVCLSLFSLAIALVFSKYAWVVCIIWLFESTLLFYFYQKTKESKIYLASIILMIIWIIKLWSVILFIWTSWMLATAFLSLLSLALSLIFLQSDNSGTRVIHDILHIAWIYLVWHLLIGSIAYWDWEVLITAFYFLVLSIFYSKYCSSALKVAYLFALWFISLFHISEVQNLFWSSKFDAQFSLKFIHYLSTFIFSIWAFAYNKISKYSSSYIALIIISFYLMIITTTYVYDIFEDVFIISMYWWAIAFISLYCWIQKDLKKYRTIWLYILVLTLWKILLFDIWFNIDEPIFRVLALMLVWALMIVISSMYSKRYWWNLKGEFDLNNLKE